MRITVFEKVSLPEPVQLSSKTSQKSSNEKEKPKEAKETKDSAATTAASETGYQAPTDSSTESSQSLSAELDSLKAATEMDYLEPPLASPEVSAHNISIVDIGWGLIKQAMRRR